MYKEGPTLPFFPFLFFPDGWDVLGEDFSAGGRLRDFGGVFSLLYVLCTVCSDGKKSPFFLCCLCVKGALLCLVFSPVSSLSFPLGVSSSSIDRKRGPLRRDRLIETEQPINGCKKGLFSLLHSDTKSKSLLSIM